MLELLQDLPQELHRTVIVAPTFFPPKLTRSKELLPRSLDMRWSIDFSRSAVAVSSSCLQRPKFFMTEFVHSESVMVDSSTYRKCPEYFPATTSKAIFPYGMPWKPNQDNQQHKIKPSFNFTTGWLLWTFHFKREKTSCDILNMVIWIADLRHMIGKPIPKIPTTHRSCKTRLELL